MTDTTPAPIGAPVPRYKIGYRSDEWGERSSTPGGIPDPAGAWVRYDDHAAALASAAQPAVPPGYALVPVEPTDKMVQAALYLDLSYMPGQDGADRAAVYRAMLAAAPKAAPGEPTPELQRMTASRAAFFMERFLREEKLLGPNERAAVQFALNMLEAAPQQEAQEPVAWRIDSQVVRGRYITFDEHPGLAYPNAQPLYTAPQPAPVAQVDALPREELAWLVVQEACETEPADEDDPECIRILRRDLKSAVLAALLRLDAARAQAKEGGTP